MNITSLKERNLLDHFLSVIISNRAYSSKSNLSYRLLQIFSDVNFNGKRVLEVGGGYGMFSYYASIMGASKVVNLEPEGDGSTSGAIKLFTELKEKLDITNVELIVSTLQDYYPKDKEFDIIILYNSINHLNEKACIELRSNTQSRSIYLELFSKLASLSKKDAKIIICDCSNYNIFPLFGLRNPFDPKIEWHKHQSPNVWIELLLESGFNNPKLSWNTFNRFKKAGKLIFGNKIAAYFFTSHFCMKMNRE